MSALIGRQTRALTGLSNDFAASLSDQDLGRSLPGRSNTIGAQFWCVVGGRESYLKALQAGQWEGFACSLTNEETHTGEVLTDALMTTRESWLQLDLSDLDEYQQGMMLRLNEHEAQHQGQLIRFAYNIGLDIPDSWKEHWALTD